MKITIYHLCHSAVESKLKDYTEEDKARALEAFYNAFSRSNPIAAKEIWDELHVPFAHYEDTAILEIDLPFDEALWGARHLELKAIDHVKLTKPIKRHPAPGDIFRVAGPHMDKLVLVQHCGFQELN